MKPIFNLLAVLILFNFIGACHAEIPAEKSTTDKLVLHLSTAKTSQNKVSLTIVLQNLSNETVSISVPKLRSSLGVRLLTPKGRVYALNQLLKRGKRTDNINKTIMIKPKEKISYKRSFDLTEFRTEIADKTFVEFRAHFRYIINDDWQEESKRLVSNKAKYFL
ncbi:MAG: hypothetical protein HRT35_09905 [Algicola sp.]|nr:hypothetical protein [Algicola sp.]